MDRVIQALQCCRNVGGHEAAGNGSEQEDNINESHHEHSFALERYRAAAMDASPIARNPFVNCDSESTLGAPMMNVKKQVGLRHNAPLVPLGNCEGAFGARVQHR
jgi:hypothetical protein